MRITCLFAQRRESYPGQYAPELMGAADEMTESENPDYLNAIEEGLRKDEDLVMIRRIFITVPWDKITEAFDVPTVEGVVQTPVLPPAPEEPTPVQQTLKFKRWDLVIAARSRAPSPDHRRGRIIDVGVGDITLPYFVEFKGGPEDISVRLWCKESELDLDPEAAT